MPEQTTLTLEDLPDGGIITLSDGRDFKTIKLSHGQLSLLMEAIYEKDQESPPSLRCLTLLEFPS